MLDRYDGPGACFYLDPPYHPATRGERGLRRNTAYVHELSAEDHEDLVAAAVALEGSVLLSGYDHEAYAPLPDAGFERFSFANNATASRVLSGRGPRLEVLWRRLEPGVHLAQRLWSDDHALSVASHVDDELIPAHSTVLEDLEEAEHNGVAAS